MTAFASVPPALTAAVLPTISNLFTTVAWYRQLRHRQAQPCWIAAIVAGRLALLEYLLQGPENLIGSTTLSLAQLEVMREASRWRCSSR